MENLINLKHSDGSPADLQRTKFVIVIYDGKDVLGDPSKQGVWWTYSKYEAKRMCKVISKDFQQQAYIFPLEEALRIIALKRYGIELKAPYTYDNLSRQIIDYVITKGRKPNANN